MAEILMNTDLLEHTLAHISTYIIDFYHLHFKGENTLVEEN